MNDATIVRATAANLALLDKVADVYERETESKIMAMTSMLEPVMSLVMGVVVGVIVISILLRIYARKKMIR